MAHNHHDHDDDHHHLDSHVAHEPAHQHRHRHGHDHHHAHGAPENIGFAFILNFIFSLIELFGGLMIGSVAIVAGAIHDFGDAVSLGIAWILERFANRKRDDRFNFGYRRLSLLSAFVTGVVISTGSVVIIVQSFSRFQEHAAPPGLGMIALASLGLFVNGFAAWRLSRGKTQNEKVLTWHLIEDFASWAIVLLGGLVIHLTQWSWLDPGLAIALSIFVLFNVFGNLKHTVYLFLQGRPPSFDEALFLKESLAVFGVEHVDHLAVWSLDGETNILSARLHLHGVRDPIEIERVKEGVRKAAQKQNALATLETCLAASAPHSDES